MPQAPGPKPISRGPLEIVLATRNDGKVREFLELLADLPVQVYSLAAFPQIPPLREDGSTYTENAIGKAVTVARMTGRVTIADDSGIEVDALGGEPGPFSNRFMDGAASETARNARLLKLLRGTQSADRTARYRAVLAVALPGGVVRTFEGICEGQVLTAPRGSGGFGYDPIFYIPREGKTMAQLSLAAKNRISHRARAMAAARPFIRKIAVGAPAPAGDA
jgi:XTP/dITP diphosphohydrolase